jgi:hypothetical protein
MKRFSKKVNKRPPKYNISFEEVANIVNSYIKEDGFSLNFTGYKVAMKNYFQLHEHDLLQAHGNMVSCNMWFNYFSEVYAFIELGKESWFLEEQRLLAYVVKDEPNEELEDFIENAKHRTMHYKVLSKHLRNQMIFFSKASDHCLRLYQNGIINYARS